MDHEESTQPAFVGVVNASSLDAGDNAEMISLNYWDSQVNRFPDGTVVVLGERKPPLYFTGADAEAIWAEFQKLRAPLRRCEA